MSPVFEQKIPVIQETKVIPNKAIEPDALQRAASQESDIEVKDIEIYRLTDIHWRLENREKFKNFLIRLLVTQNVVVFALVIGGMVADKMAGLQLVFATLVGGTLLETAAMVHLIVKWLFSEINYTKREAAL